MSETTTPSTALTSHYSAQVTEDLERNLQEQERLSGEIEALQTQLASLRHDNTVLVNIQQALVISAAPSPEAVAAVPTPRTEQQPTAKAAGKQKQVGKTAAPAGKRKQAGKPTGKTTAMTSAASSTPATLVEIVREHLTGQSEPRSAAEITTAVGQQHPERAIKTTVVRTTLEGLVARNQAQGTKQGASVFYTAPEVTQPASAAQTESQPELASP